MYTEVWYGILNEREQLEGFAIDWRIILKTAIEQIKWERLGWTYLAQDRDNGGLLRTRWQLFMREFRLVPRCCRGAWSSEMLRGVYW